MNGLMKSFVDEMLKISGVVGATARAIVKHKKPLAIAGLGAAGLLAAQRGVQDIQIGEQVRKQSQ